MKELNRLRNCGQCGMIMSTPRNTIRGRNYKFICRFCVMKKYNVGK